MTNDQLDQLSINTLRTLSMDAVQQAKSGHPGTPMALAPMVCTIGNRAMSFDAMSFDPMSFDPQGPIWPNRDRFVLSNGHASMLIWSVGWERYVGPTGRVIGLKTFGASAPLKELQRKVGFEPDRVVAAAKEQLAR